MLFFSLRQLDLLSALWIHIFYVHVILRKTGLQLLVTNEEKAIDVMLNKATTMEIAQLKYNIVIKNKVTDSRCVSFC